MTEFIKSIRIADAIQIGILIVATFAIVIPAVQSYIRSKTEKRALKAALQQEMLANIHSLFNGGIERPFIYKSFESFVQRLSFKIEDESEFQKLISLYVDFMDFREVTRQFWPPENPTEQNRGDLYQAISTRSNLICSRKRLETMNSLLRYFKHKPLTFDEYDLTDISQKIDKAREIRNRLQKKWHHMLEENLDRII